MAAYAAAVTSKMSRAVKVDQVTGIGMFAGSCNLSNYNTTLAQITAITGKFKSVIAVIPAGVSSNGYLVYWDATDNAFRARYSEGAHTHTENLAGAYTQNATTAANAAAAGEEVANDVDIGTFDFVAYGLV